MGKYRGLTFGEMTDLMRAKAKHIGLGRVPGTKDGIYSWRSAAEDILELLADAESKSEAKEWP